MSRTCVSSTVRLAATRLCREAAALRRTAGARVLQYSSASSWLTGSTGPGHAYLAVRRNKPVQHGSRPRIGRQLSTLVALAVGEEDQPWPEAAQHHQPADGTPSLVALARVMASGIGWPTAQAASSHAESWRSGSASKSVTSTRPVSRP